MNSYTSLAAREYKKDRSITKTDLAFRPFFTFFKSYFLKKGYKDGTPGFIISAAAACHVFLKYAKTWELKNVKEKK
jgi:hypothetical protein